MFSRIKYELAVVVMSIVSAVLVASCTVTALAYPTYTNSNYANAEALKICKKVRNSYSNIPAGLLEAIVLSQPSNLYQVGPMHLDPEKYKERMVNIGVTDINDTESNIRLGADRISELITRYQDIYIVLVNFFYATEEQDPYISEVVTRFSEINSEYRNQK